MTKNSRYAYSKNTVREAVRSGNALRVFVDTKTKGDAIVSLAKKQGIPVSVLTEEQLTKMASTDYHQGFVAEVKDYRVYKIGDVIREVKGKKEPLIVVLDGIKDPHNLGAILRSCDAFGVDALVMRNRNEVPLNATVARVSTGAIDYVKVITVTNLSQALSELKDAGFWVVSTDGSASKNLEDVDYHCPICLVIGSEGEGISRLVLQNSDFIVKIPMVGHVNSLNASVSAGIAIAEISLLRK